MRKLIARITERVRCKAPAKPQADATLPTTNGLAATQCLHCAVPDRQKQLLPVSLAVVPPCNSKLQVAAYPTDAGEIPPRDGGARFDWELHRQPFALPPGDLSDLELRVDFFQYHNAGPEPRLRQVARRWKGK